MNGLTIIEREGKRVLTTQQLAEAYGVDDKKIRDNFTNNKSRYIEGKHFIKLEGEELKQFKNDTEIFGVVGERTSSVYLWTEAGTLHHAKSLGTDKAWDVFEQLEDTYFRVKELSIAINKLSPELQMFKQIFDSVAQSQLEQQKMRMELQKTKEEVQAIKDVIVINPQAEWRKRTNKILNEIGLKLNGNYKLVRDEVYEALKQRANCRPNILINNLKSRALLNGMAMSKADELNILDVLENEPRLREIYVTIVKEMAIKNGVWIREGQA